VQLYIDTSALVKLVTVEQESAALRGYLEQTVDDAEFTAAITRTELVRAAARLRNADIDRQATLLLTSSSSSKSQRLYSMPPRLCRRQNSAPPMRFISPPR